MPRVVPKTSFGVGIVLRNRSQETVRLVEVREQTMKGEEPVRLADASGGVRLSPGS
jgi:hypothetical protein